ncbi:MAG: smpB [Chloroflexi bacterium]|nr:smpB [Chloroflexota bacterium]
MTATQLRERVYATNRRALHEYLILETIEVGVILTGTEIKSVRAGRVNLREAYGRVDRRELWLHNAHISPYDPGSHYNHEPTRTRKLLAHTREIGRLWAKQSESGITLIPLKMYDRRGHVKVELALARGKHTYDKRNAIAERDARREMERAVKRDFN